ncbi:MAG: glycosyltransferase [Candidatus Goldbacteria bacterium]|nr:glycosyltransferase [Candidatus Goldiibacteriota bacterium]
MKKVDLHLHTKYSDRPSEWFLQKLGTYESYTEPEIAFKKAINAGMDFVTITDHNSITAAVELKKIHPEKIITGTEITTYFPEDGCKIHLLLYGITESEFKEINILRDNIYRLREYIVKNNIAHSVAHAIFSINNKLTINHFEKLILLFNVFEIINGSRDYNSSSILELSLKNLTREKIVELYNKHKIEPISKDPWIKGFTGGSDDHSGIFIGKTWTEAENAKSPEDFIDKIRNKKTKAVGRNNTYHSFVFSIYKIAYDFSQRKSSNNSKNLLGQITEYIFNKENLNFTDKLKLNNIKKNIQNKKSNIYTMIIELIEEIHRIDKNNLDYKFDIVYEKISNITDELTRMLFKSLDNDIKFGNIMNIIKSVSSSVPALFLSLPFFTALKHFNKDKNLINEIKKSFIPNSNGKHKRILWFTDTITDLNGVSNTLRTLAEASYKMQKEIFMITCCEKNKDNYENNPPNTIILPHIFSLKLPNYENYILNIPSILKSIKIIYDLKPDEIFISTPGPIGITGLLFAKILNLKCCGIFHTDFTEQIKNLINDESIAELAESGLRWFYSYMDEIYVPTNEYIDILKKRGYQFNKMLIFKRGIDTRHFVRCEEGKIYMQKNFNLKTGPVLLYSGRISKDKNLDFLREIFLQVSNQIPNVNLIIAGDGPYLDEFKSTFHNNSRVIFTGRQKYEIMPLIYSAADVLLFPSNTDTFGMSVLEAQACSVPAIVSDIGGPKEIIAHFKTGLIAKANNLNDWVTKTIQLLKTIELQPDLFNDIKKNARKNVILNYDWSIFINSITSPSTI